MNKTFWRLAWRGLIRNQRRTLLTALAFIIGYTGLSVMAGYIYRVEKVLRTGAIYQLAGGHIRIHKKGIDDYWAKPKKYLVSAEHVALLRGALLPQLGADVEFASEKLKVAAQLAVGDRSVPVLLSGLDMAGELKARTHPELQKWYYPFFSYKPSPFSLLADGHYGVSITPNIARGFGHPAQSEKDAVHFDAQLVGLDFESSLNAIDVTVNKLHMSGSQFLQDLSMEMDIRDLQKFVNNDGITEFSLYLSAEASLSEVLTRVQEFLVQKGLNDLEARRFDGQDVTPEYTGNMGLLLVIMLFFLILIGGSVVLSVLNVLTMSIFERSMEIGTLLSLGFSRWQVRSLFVLEGLIMGGGGIAIGGILSGAVASFINQLEIHFQPPGALGVATVFVDQTVSVGATIALVMLTMLLIASYLLTQQQTRKKLVQLLYDVEGNS
jgi:putative ABC transport system permease protein